MIVVACALWDANDFSSPFSRHYTETDVERLYRGFQRHMPGPFRFICWSEKDRNYAHPEIEQRKLTPPREPVCYRALSQLYETNEPTILCGLDTIVTGDLADVARYCMEATKPAAPIDPFKPETVCNGVVLAPAGCAWLYTESPMQNDMDWVRDLYKAKRVDTLDAVLPGQIVSYKGEVKKRGLGDARIVYFHGEHKPHELPHVGWIDQHWR